MLLKIEDNVTQHDNMTAAFVYMFSINKDPSLFLNNDITVNKKPMTNKIKRRIKKSIKEAKKELKKEHEHV